MPEQTHDQQHQTNSATAAERLQRAVGDRYAVEGQVGEGGMATVFLAEDRKHHRKVAIKILHETLAHTIGIKRFLQEIEVIARLQHPHLLTLIDSGDVDGLPYYVMPYLEAQSLRELITKEKRLGVDQAVAITREVADGLSFAHANGVIHRDIKPSNILMSGGHAVVADFGIATALENAAVGRLTETGISLGSPTYMSPEQASGERDLDERTDVYSVGCVLYEMLTGEPPIDAGSMQQMVTRKLTGEFTALRTRRPDVPPALEAAIHKALATERPDRFQSVREFSAAIGASTSAGKTRASRRTLILRAAAAIVVAAGVAFWIQSERRKLWAAQRIAEVDRLASNGEFASAFEVARGASATVPRDTALQRLLPRFADFVRIVTAPSGARVYWQRMNRPDSPWELVGTTPLDSVAMPKWGVDFGYRLRIEKDGYQRADLLPDVFAPWASWRGVRPVDTLRLDALADAEEGMVRIPGWRIVHPLNPRDSLTIGDYHIGRNEVTNREFKRFVDAGGYTKREYWTEPFVRDGRRLSWDEAMALFRDRSGLPGPSMWNGGTYSPGQEEFPAGGVSWYEAMAYARFAGKQLPTSAHWFRAALMHHREAGWLYTPTSNLSNAEPRAVGQGVMNSYGLHDVLGNVREWCVNPLEFGRLTRGGGWEDADFHVGHLIPKGEFDRAPSNGFRVVKLTDHDTTLARLSGRLTRAQPRDFSRVAAASDAEFRIYRRQFDYDPLPLNARRDTGGVVAQFRWEKVSFTGPAGGERMAAYVFLPKDAAPPYQAVILWHGSPALSARRFDPQWFNFENLFGFIPRSGRALVLPLLKGTFERDDSAFTISGHPPAGSTLERDLTVLWHKELRRTVDYLESRTDIASGQVGFYGFSWGGGEGPITLAVEPRIRAAVLNVGGLWPLRVPLPEVDPFNYLPRVRTPTLMLNGRHDTVFPYETSQLPFFRMLGTAPADKKHFVYPAGHLIPQRDMVRETLAWFDTYLGRDTPVGRDTLVSKAPR